MARARHVPQDRTRRLPARDARRVMDVDQTAALLGTTPDAVRKRLRRGTLPGQKVGDTWQVWLNETARDTSHEPSREARDQTSHKPPGHEPPSREGQETPSETALLRLELTHTQELLSEVRAERDRLARQVEQDAVERAELRRLLASQLPIYLSPGTPTGEPAPVTPPPADAEPRRKWWQVWRFIPATSPTAS